MTAFRVLAFGYAVILVAVDHHEYTRPSLGWALLAVMALWTVVTAASYDVLSRWPWWLIGADVAAAAGLVLATLAVQSHARIDGGAPTVPAAWAAAPVLIAAIAGGPALGGLAAVAVSTADIIERRGLSQHTFNGVVLLLMAGVVGGYVVRLGQRAEDAIAVAARRESAAAERDRLAREIHDSALQVLALVAKRGAVIGGETAELAALAAEQEAALRRLVASPAGTPSADERDLRPMLSGFATSRITVSAPADAVIVREATAIAVTAAVAEAIANVERHAGSAASAWILLECDRDSVIVSVRDDGVGMPPGRLAAAGTDGRLGVAHSIIGRIGTVGGAAHVTSTPDQGTEVEIRVPR